MKRFYKAKKIAEKNEELLKRCDNRFALFRLISTLVLISILFSFYQKITVLLSIVFFLVFVVFLSFFHKKIQTKMSFWSALVKSYEQSLFRSKRSFSKLKWQERKQEQGLEQHPYAFDLDVKTHLFPLLNTCSTLPGSDKLLSALLQAGTIPEDKHILENRIKMGSMLSCYPSFLRRFESLRFHENVQQIDTFQVSSVPVIWKENVRIFYGVFHLFAWLGLIFPVVDLAFLKHDLSMEVISKPLLLYTAVLLTQVFLFQSMIKQSWQMIFDTRLFSKITHFFSTEKKIADKIEFDFLKQNALGQIRFLSFLIDVISVRGNPVFWIAMHLIFPFDAVLSLLLQWKLRRVQSSFSKWQQELYELDVIICFARLKNENPECHFLSSEELSFSKEHFLETKQMGHVLLPKDRRVCNDFKLDDQGALVLLTGSNMSGKSTFMRALATNVLLANVGAPVCAQTFFVPRTALLCAIRINDSLAQGTSYFYAEVKRLKMILDQLSSSETRIPALFLIDEIFKGTNNKERFVGSWSVIRALLKTNCLGVVSTHDLSLCDLEKQDQRLKNMHFKEHLQDGKLVFDYQIQPGPCPTTNALWIMKSEGLPIADDAILFAGLPSMVQ